MAKLSVGRQSLWTLGSAAATAAALFAPLAANASTVQLATGELLGGHFTGFENGRAAVHSERFGDITIEPGAIVSLEESGLYVVDTVSGERLQVGSLKADPDGIRGQTRFGELGVRWADVLAIHQAPEQPAPGPAPAPHPPKNELKTSFAVAGNELGGFLGVSRSYLASNELSYTRAVSNDTSVVVAMPFYFQSTRLSGGGESDTTTKSTGIGDLTIGVVQGLHLGRQWPDAHVQLTAGIPTGRAGGPNDTTLLDLSSGSWSVGGAVHLNVPLDHFGGLMASFGTSHYWSRADSSRQKSNFNWSVGYALPLEGSRTLGIGISGAVTKQEGVRSEPAYISFRLSQDLQNGISISPSFAHGLNSDAQDFLISLDLSKAW